jgi:hypothetical protein
MDSLLGKATRCVLENWNKMRRDVMSVEDGGARLERRGDPILERHDVSSMKDSVYEENQLTVLAENERE